MHTYVRISTTVELHNNCFILLDIAIHSKFFSSALVDTAEIKNQFVFRKNFFDIGTNVLSRMDFRHGSFKSRNDGGSSQDLGRERDYFEPSKPRPPPVSEREVEMCMDELEIRMKSSRKSPDEKNSIKLEGINPVKEESENVLFDYRKGNNEPFLGVRFIFECGELLSTLLFL